MYYLYNDDSEIVLKSDVKPSDENKYGILNLNLDLDSYYYYIIGSLDANHNITYYTRKVRSADYMAKNLKDKDDMINTLGQQLVSLQLAVASIQEQGGGST